MIGLGFGDCGKGRFVDELCHRLQAHTVVRYNGGAQAGHTVCRPDGRFHIFSQFGAGTFRGARTLLAAPVVIHPGGLLREAEALARLGLGQVLERLTIDGSCRVTTPFLQAAGRLRELARFPAIHGTCGIGFGATVELSIEAPEWTLRYGDLVDPALCLAKLEGQRRYLQDSLERHLGFDLESLPSLGGAQWAEAHAEREWQVFATTDLAQRWLASVLPLVRQVPPAEADSLRQNLQAPGTVIFEGAQGLLLDENLGFHPHTTWSSVGPRAAAGVLQDLAIDAPLRHWGALRTYLTRHGAGPLPSWDPNLDRLAEPHNLDTGWQGVFRRGHPDQVLLRYALAVAPELEGLLVSHLDVFSPAAPELRWCEAYAWPDLGQLEELSELTSAPPELERQERWARRLGHAVPCFAPAAITSADQWQAEVEQLSQRPILLTSHGPLPGQTAGRLGA